MSLTADHSAAAASDMISPDARIHSVGLAETQWTRGFWADRFNLCRTVMIPAMGKLMEGVERTHFFQNLRIAAGLAEGRHRGAKWNDGDFYKWLEAAAAVYAFTKDPRLDERMDRIIDVIARAQRADGYIHTPVLIAQRNGNDAQPFADPMHFEMYNMGHLILAACVHHRATGKDTLLRLARKTADFLDDAFRHPTPEQARHGICPSHLMGLAELYHTTREQRYLALAERLLNMRDLVASGDDDNQDRIPFREQTEAVGHAVRATYLYAGAADIYAETGDATLLKPLHRIWQDLVSRKLYVTGGCGALFDGASPHGSPDQLSITRVHQAFGRPYQLPHSTAHNETCAAIGNLLWNWRMFQITGEARFADLIEQTLYNSVLAGISLDGTRFFYTNTLRQLNPMPLELRWPRRRQEFISCFCCPPNVVRTIAEASSYAYARSPRGVWVVLYGGSRLETTLAGGTPVKLTQETDYPWDGRIRIAVDVPQRTEFSLMLRIPAWAKGATATINGQPSTASPAPGSFHEIRRAWSSGDIVQLDLPMPVRLLEANPYVEEARNHVAVIRGPIVYCLESIDLPPHVRVMDVAVPADAQFAPRRVSELGAVVVLEGKGMARESGDWSGKLYREYRPAAAREVDLRLIPYYAWDNRGESEMTVWLPAAPSR